MEDPSSDLSAVCKLEGRPTLSIPQKNIFPENLNETSASAVHNPLMVRVTAIVLEF